MREHTPARPKLSRALALLALVIGPGLAWGHTPDAPASGVPGDWLWVGALLVASLFVLRARRRPRFRPTASRLLLAPTMTRRRWLSVAVTSLLLFYAAETPPHSVHHGLDHDSAPNCPILAISDQTSGEPPDLLTLNIPAPLPSTATATTLDLIPCERSFYAVPRPRAPPPSLPS
jgi:hypothetical protein